MNGLKSMLGMRSKAEKSAQKEAERAVKLQQRTSEEASARERADAEAAGRRLMRGGSRSLTWQGGQSAAATTFGG